MVGAAINFLECAAANWLTHISLGVGILISLFKSQASQNWTKQVLFFNATNAASALVLFTVLVFLWAKPTLTGDIAVNNAVIVTWGIIYALHDNIADLLKLDKKPAQSD